MLLTGLQLSRCRAFSRLSSHQRAVRRNAATPRRATRPTLNAAPSPGTSKSLLALLTAMAGVELSSSPVFGTIESEEFIAKHFDASQLIVQQDGLHTLLTSTLYTPVISYNLHNMLWLAIAGRHVCRALGGAKFLALFVGSGALANVVSLTSGAEQKQDHFFPRLPIPGGSSAAVDCIVTLNALTYPPSRVAIARRWMRWPLWFLSVMFLTRDEQDRPPWESDSAPRQAHATGVLCGLVTFLVLRRRPRW